MKTFIDITRTLGIDTLDFPGDIKFGMTEVMSFKKGDDWNMFKLEMTNHTGTHVDAPLHKYKNGKSLNDFPLSDYELKCVVIEIKNAEKVTLDGMKNINIPKGGAVLFKTTNSRLSRKKFSKKFVYVDPSVAEYLVAKGVKLVGIDYLSLDPLISEYPVHQILLSNNVIIMEDAFLKDVEPGNYTLLYLPMKIKNANGAPVRALLIK
jgi:arylformamidase